MLNKFKYSKIIIILLSVLMIGILLKANLREARQMMQDNKEITAGGNKIRLFERGDERYLFLPSGCDLNAVMKKNAGLLQDVRILQSANIPAVFITTRSGSMDAIHADKGVEEKALLKTLSADGNTCSNHELKGIHARGNSTFTEYDKKSYLLTFKYRTSFLGMSAGEKFCLLSNAPDQSLIRNAVTRDLAGALELPGAEAGVFVDLYLNGEYAGNYYAVPKVSVQEGLPDITDLKTATARVNTSGSYEEAWTERSKYYDIANDPEDITGGYLIERDYKNRFDIRIHEKGSGFITNRGECFMIGDNQCLSKAQMEYISSFIQNVEDAIFAEDSVCHETGEALEDMADLRSLAAKYLLEEVSSNYDGGVTSSYFYKDSDSVDTKLYAGPVWDYDITWGSIPAFIGDVDTDPGMVSKLSSWNENGTEWFEALCEKDEFMELVLSLYNEIVSGELEYLAGDFAPALSAAMEASHEMDVLRWQEQYLAAGMEEAFDGNVYEGIERENELLIQYIRDRKTALDAVFR